MDIQGVLTTKVKEAVNSIFHVDLELVEFQPTRKDFEGDITVVVFPLLNVVTGNPQVIGDQIGTYLVDNVEEINSLIVI